MSTASDARVPTIAVILPVYNRRATVSQSIESVLAQTFSDFQLIIIDDGSVDGTDEVIRPYLANPKIRYHRQPNSGRPSLARNTGIALASSPWLAFIDSDDLWLPTKLERQMALVQEAADAGMPLDMVLGDYEVVTNGQLSSPSFFADYQVWQLLRRVTELGCKHGFVFSRDGLLQALYRKGFAATQAVLVKRSVVEDCGRFDPELTFAEDNDLWMKVAERGRVGCVHGPVHRYIIHGENITSVKVDRYFTDTIRVLLSHQKVAKMRGLGEGALRERMAYYQLSLAEFQFRSGDFFSACSNLWRALPGLHTQGGITLY